MFVEIWNLKLALLKLQGVYMRVRPQHDLSAHLQSLIPDQGESLVIKIFSPFHENTDFLLLDALDYIDGSYGLDLSFVLAACSVMTATKGALYPRSDNSDGSLPDAIAGAVRPGKYIYRGTENIPYDICPSFKEWTFLEHLIPQEWYDLENQEAIYDRPVVGGSKRSANARARYDGTCVISGYETAIGIETCYLIPRARSKWVSHLSLPFTACE